MTTPPRWRSYSSYFKEIFNERVQKVTLDAGFSCPNRDGTLSQGGCTFCLNDAFSPSYCTAEKSITEQIDEGIEFHSRRYAKAEKFLAYFQAYSNTHKPLHELKAIYSQALSHPNIVGLVVGTRPDCVDQAKIDYFAELAQTKYVIIEYGVESCYDSTLLSVNRGHNFETARRAIEMTAERGVRCGAHFILGLPGESRQMVIDQCQMINNLPIDTIKFHQLQIFKGTPMATDFELHPQKYHFWELEEYIDLVIDILELLRPDLVIERFAGEAPPRYHAGHPWGLVRNERLWQMLEKRMVERNAFQGQKFH
ncbi:MAG: TIGR01212 family radical SAM protein [Mucinivorans sp.]